MTTNEKEAIFMLGLPGSGKSTWIAENIDLVKYHMVSADEIRVKHDNYDPKNPEEIHEECVRLAEEQMYILAENGLNIVMDGGGINNNYTTRIITRLKDKHGYKIKIVFINTPVSICIERNKDRVKNNERFVPNHSIIDKAYRLEKSVDKLVALSDNFLVVNYFTNKYVFVDLDGTVAEYQQLPTDEYGDVNFVEYEVFKKSKPVMPMILRLKRLHAEGKRIFIVSASPNSICNIEKKEWVNKYLPFVNDSDIYFVGNKTYKYVFLYQLINKLKFDPKDCMAIDDDHNVLTSYKQLNINSIHPSYFLTNF